MATITWYLRSTTVDGWQGLSTSVDAGGIIFGWVVGTGLTNSSEFVSGAVADRASTTFVANTVPDGTLDTTLKDAFRTPILNGTFASANWVFTFDASSPIQAGAADGQFVIRLIKANADGSSATLVTAAQQALPILTNVTVGNNSSQLVLNPGAITFNNQYLFIQVAWKRTGAGGMSTTNIRPNAGQSVSIGTFVTSSEFTPGTQTVTTVAIASTVQFFNVVVMIVGVDQAIVLPTIVSAATVYSTPFSGTESPLSESGHWIACWGAAITGLKKDDGAYFDGSNGASRLTDPVSADQYAEIGYNEDPGASSWIGVLTRIQYPSSGSGYLAIAYDNEVRLYNAVDSGTIAFTLLAFVAASIGTAPRHLRLTSIGNTHTVAFNGVDVLVYVDTVPLYTSGYLGAAASTFGGPVVDLDYFDGGEAAVPSVFVPSVSIGEEVVTVGGATLTIGSSVSQPAVTPGPVAVTGATVPTGWIVRVPIVAVGAVTVTGATRASTIQVFVPMVLETGTLGEQTIGSTLQMFVPTVVPAAMTVSGATRTTTVQLNAPMVIVPVVGTVIGATLISSGQVGGPTVVPGVVSVSTAAIASVIQVFALSLGGFDQEVGGFSISSGAQVFVPRVSFSLVLIRVTSEAEVRYLVTSATINCMIGAIGEITVRYRVMSDGVRVCCVETVHE